MKKHRRLARAAAPDRRGAALVLAVILMFGLCAFLALSIDTGFLAASRAEMRRAADAAAMAGCWELHQQLEQGHDIQAAQGPVQQTAANLAAMNCVCRVGPTLDVSGSSGDISVGFVSDLQTLQFTADDTLGWQGVQATVRRTADANGEIPFFFGRIFGRSGTSMETTSTAVMARQISGFAPPTEATGNLPMLPFALDLETWLLLCAGSTTDAHAYDTNTDTIYAGSDGLLEANLYPQGTGSPGNRGTIDIGGSSNSTSDIARQILHGVSKEDFDALGKPLQLVVGSTMTLNGDTGISAGVKDELASIVGQKRMIPIFSTVLNNGNNAEYAIVRWAGVRVLKVDLSGALSGKEVIVQPASMIVPQGIAATDSGIWSDRLFTPVVLAQ